MNSTFRTSRRPLTPKSRSAFTLVEVMTATAIMVIIIVFTLNIATSTVRIYDNAINSLRATSESRTVLNAITQDFQSAIVRDSDKVWIQIEHEEDVGNVSKANAPQIMLFAPVPERLKREAASLPEERIPGAICAIKYQIGHRSPFDDPGEPIQQIYGLYRAIVDAQATFEGPLKSLFKPNTNGANTEPLDIWRSERANVLDAAGNRSSQQLAKWSTEPQNFHASGVVSIALLFYFQEADSTGEKKTKILAHTDLVSSVRENLSAAKIENIEVIPYMNSVKIVAGNIYEDTPSLKNVNPNGPSRTLRNIEVIATLLDSDGDSELRGRQRTRRNSKINQEDFNRIVRQHGYTFTASIPITQQ